MAFKNSNLRCLSTNRLFLRPMLASDAGQVVAWRNSEHVAKMSSQSIKADLTEEHHLEWFFESRNSRIDYLIIHKKLEQPMLID
jgi:RimJ/RimL family protein N-acetyltransferase